MVARMRIVVGLSGGSCNSHEQTDTQDFLPKQASKFVVRLNHVRA